MVFEIKIGDKNYTNIREVLNNGDVLKQAPIDELKTILDYSIDTSKMKNSEGTRTSYKK